MEPLLIVLVIGCASASAVHMGRGLWARSRSVQRHHQALDTLGDITRQETPAYSTLPANPAPPGHQAHVRIIGPGGQVTDAPVLPPPRPSFTPGNGRLSPFRRPSRSAPSLAAMDAVAASTSLRSSPNTTVLRSNGRLVGELPRVPTPLPASVAVRRALQDQTMPGGLPPVEPVPLDERSTRPVPVAKSDVFYFDDLGARPAPVRSPVQVAVHAEPSLSPVGTSDAITIVPDADPSPDMAVPEVTPPMASTELWATRSGVITRPGARKGLVAAVLAVAAVCVALAAVGLDMGGSTPPTAGTASGANRSGASSAPPGARPRSQAKAPGSGAKGRATLKGSGANTAAARPSTVAALVSSSAGAAVYHISSTADSIVVTAKGPCWLEVRADSPSGQVVYEGTLEAGQRSSVTGPAWIRLGDPPEVSVLVDGKTMDPPGAEVAEPLNLQFTLG